MDNLCVDEEEGHQDVNENTCIEFSVRNRYGSLHDIVQEECNNDHVAHLQVRQKGEANFDYSCLNNQDVIRPSYYILRLLGLWIPATAGCLWKFYHYFVVPVLWLGTITANIMLCHKDKKFHWKMFLNSLTTSVTLGCPYWFSWIYLRKGNYDGLLLYLTNTKKTTHDKVKRYSKIYTCLSIFLWILGGVFFYFHWIPLFRGFKWTLLYYILYFLVGFLSTGWWASWFGLYGFVCRLHKLQIDRFCRELNFMYGYSNHSTDIETSTVAILLDKFHDIRFWLDKTHKMFRFMISIAFIYHFVDLFIFTVAYWTHDFGDDYRIWHYIGGIAFNILSILANLYPAAMIGQALHAIVFYAGEHCDPRADLMHVPKQRFVFFRYAFLREENLGLHVLGVKITSSLTVGFVMTLITAGLTFLKYAIPFIENLKL